MVVSIILFLLGTLVVFVANANLESQKMSTRKIIDGIESALVTYYDEWGQYPPQSQLGSDPISVSTALCQALSGSGKNGIKSGTVSSLASLPAGAVATNQATSQNYFVDAWKNPIGGKVFDLGSDSAKANGGMPFLYSCGPDGLASAGYGTTLTPLPTSGPDADNISNFRDLQATGTWNYSQ